MTPPLLPLLLLALAAGVLHVSGSSPDAVDFSSIPPLPDKDNMTYTPAVLVSAARLVVSWTHSSDVTTPALSSVATFRLGDYSWTVVPVNTVLYAGGTATVIGSVVYIIGGSLQGVLGGVGNVYALDASATIGPNSLTPLDPCPVGISAHAAVAFEGVIYVAGGYAE